MAEGTLGSLDQPVENDEFGGTVKQRPRSTE